MPFYKWSVILPGVGYIIPLYGSTMAIHGATYLIPLDQSNYSLDPTSLTLLAPALLKMDRVVPTKTLNRCSQPGPPSHRRLCWSSLSLVRFILSYCLHPDENLSFSRALVKCPISKTKP